MRDGMPRDDLTRIKRCTGVMVEAAIMLVEKI
jgi:hypothetical protein